jgi:hypothetical protein
LFDVLCGAYSWFGDRGLPLAIRSDNGLLNKVRELYEGTRLAARNWRAG